jgi:mycoredoxin
MRGGTPADTPDAFSQWIFSAHPGVVRADWAGRTASGSVSAMKTRDYAPPAGSITMFSTTWCGYCTRLKHSLDREGIPYSVIDIELVPDAADVVAKVNRGNRTVPTVVFPDGTTATNPSLAEVQSRL